MTIKKLSGSKVELSITVPAAEFDGFINDAARELSLETKISGFRPGKAPKEIIEKFVGGEKIMARAADKAIKKTYVREVLGEELEVLDSPEITITKIAPGNDLEYKAVTAVMPVSEVGDYSGDISKLNKDYKKSAGSIEVSEKEVDEEIEKLRKSRSWSKPVERTCQNGDRVEINFNIYLDNVIVENGTGRKFPVVLGNSFLVPGFEENICGLKKGEEKTFELIFPDKYHSQNLAGKKTEVKVKLDSVEEVIMPEINDEFAKSLGKFENLEALKENIKEGILHEKKHSATDKNRRKILDAVFEKTKIELPDILVEEELDKMLSELEHNILASGMDLESYLGKVGKSREDIRKEWRKDAEKRATVAIALKKIAKDAKIEANKEEIEEEANKMMSYLKTASQAKQEIDPERLYDYAKNVVENEKVMQYLEKL